MDNVENPFNYNNLWRKKFHADLADKADFLISDKKKFEVICVICGEKQGYKTKS